MSFAADWLALRAPADLRARNQDLAGRLSAHFAGRTGLRVTDLGSGTGNNLRATAPLLPPGQHWRLVDNDRALLDLATPPPGVEVTPVETDLAEDPAAALGEADLVTASAFFDLCGSAWLSRFADALAAQGAALYGVLSYDGREVWSPTDTLDGAVLAAFHRDQRRDKGFGPALGPDAHAKLAELMRDRGYEVWEGSSDWELTPPHDAALIAELARGSAAAVRPSLGLEADAWEASRSSATHALIGHRDLLALPR